jgi:hypothetical protein
MENKEKILNAVKLLGSIILAFGITILLIGLVTNSIFVFLGIGVVMGAIFIYLIGLFLVISLELTRESKG